MVWPFGWSDRDAEDAKAGLAPARVHAWMNELPEVMSPPNPGPHEDPELPFQVPVPQNVLVVAIE